MNEQDGQGRQERADAVDREMAARLLPDPVVRALGRWWETNAAAYADGTPGAHSVRYTHGRWAQITPWPEALAPTSADGDAAVSRAEVASAVADALQRDAFREALAAAVTALHEHGAPQAYAALQGQVPGLGPAFFTKFLYFTGIAVPPAHGPRPLILDRVLSRHLRWMAAAVGRENSHDVDGSIAAWMWSDSNWTPHRYQVYLSFMHAAADQLTAGGNWPSGAAPDLLECALFTTSWETSG